MKKAGLFKLVIVLTVASAAIVGLHSTSGRAFYNINPPAQPGFPVLLAGGATGSIYEGSPTLADLDGDSKLEVVLGGRSLNGSALGCGGWVWAYRSNGSLYWQASVRAPVNSTPTVADINADGKLEVVVGLGGWVEGQCWDGGVEALNGQTGAQIWIFDTQDWLNHVQDGWLDGVFSTPAVGDVNGDGEPEIAFGAWDQCVYLLDHDGNPLWGNLPGILQQVYCGGHGYYMEDTVWSSPALGDMDGDGLLDIVIGTDISPGNIEGDPGGGYVLVLNYLGQTLAKRWISQVIYSSPAVVNLDNDSQSEIVVGTGTYWPGAGYYVTAYDYDPSRTVRERLVQKWRGNTRGKVFSSPGIGDLNEDGYPDVVATAYIGDYGDDSEIYAWRGNDGVQLFRTPACDSFGNSHPLRSSPTVADVDGDNHLEVLFSHSWEVSILNHNGTYHTDYSNGSVRDPICARTTPPDTDITYWTNYSVFGSPAVGDLDSDGDMEVVIGSSKSASEPNKGQLYAWTGHPTGQRPWPMFHRDALHTGNYCFTTVVPTNPATFTTNPLTNTWTNDATVYAAWSGATAGGCGVGGYSLEWSTSPTTTPDSLIDTTVANTTSSPLADGTWYFHLRTRDQWVNWANGTAHIGPFKIDTLWPTSMAHSPAYTITTNIPVRWDGTDATAGISSYDVQVRVDSGAWQDWRASVTYTSTTYAGSVNHSYCFRSRARDRAGNVESYPDNADTCTTVTAYMLSGAIRGNRGQPVFAAQVNATPVMSNTAVSGIDGTYALFFSTTGDYSLEIERSGFGELPPMTLNLSGSRSGTDFVLPPQPDSIVNGQFEEGWEGWTASGALGLFFSEATTLATTTLAHTGNAALDFSGPAIITQTITSPLIADKPTLSLVYRVTGTPQTGDQFTVTIRSASSSVSRTLPLTATNWTHAWIDVSSLVGQPLNVVLESGLGSSVHVIVDEVSLGEAAPGIYQTYLPVVLKGY